ncbi:hypothetical protein HDA40_002668 [Hamadaea flava]|nr:hypothetical protein [Hamadaea flava]
MAATSTAMAWYARMGWLIPETMGGLLIKRLAHRAPSGS